ncbi:CYTH domain-containing protein [Niallia sp. XMNu-256]|uniref:CYTH domain-containing protein n=1 Tax=Niallia sp. XMNu-256 TaxID=3082444 RepID=UPI0030CDDE3E
MSQTIEIEFKNLLNIEEFNKIKEKLHFTEDQIFTQMNHYFDTNDFALKNKGCALRIREKKTHFEMTLKQPHPDGLLETNQNLTAQEAQDFLKGGLIKDGVVKTQITRLGIDVTRLIYFGSLTTERAELTYQNGLLVLDKSSYLNTVDYEVEFEVTNRKQGLSVFKSFLTELHIPIRQTKNKIQRFYEQQQQLLENKETNEEH